MPTKLRGVPAALKKRRQIHVSGINMFNRCGMQFAYRYIQGIRRPPNAFLLCGTATDKAVKWDLDTKIVKGQLASEDELTDLAAEAIDNYPQRDELQLDPEDAGKSIQQVLGHTKDKAVRMVRVHHGEVAPSIQPFRTARKFTVNLDKFLRARAKAIRKEIESPDLSPWRKRIMEAHARALGAAALEGIDFVGEQDIVEKFQRYEEGPQIFNIRDTKTSTRSKNQEEIDADDQLTAYATASMVIDGKLPDNLMLDVLIDRPVTKKRFIATAEPQTLTTHRDQQHVDVFLNRVANAIGAIQQGVFAPTQQTNWWCSQKFCAYHSHCPYFKQASRPTADTFNGVGGEIEDLIPILNKSIALATNSEGENDE